MSDDCLVCRKAKNGLYASIGIQSTEYADVVRKALEWRRYGSQKRYWVEYVRVSYPGPMLCRV